MAVRERELTDVVAASDEQRAPHAPVQQQMVQVTVDDSTVVTHYANFIRVSGSPEELIIDFGLNPQPVGTPSHPIRVDQRIILNYFSAKRFVAALQVSVQRHEAVFGVLETDIQKRLSKSAWSEPSPPRPVPSPQPEVERLVLPVRVEIYDDDVSLHEGRLVAEAAIDYLKTLGFVEEDSEDRWERVGSFFTRIRMAWKTLLGKQEVQDALGQVERGLKAKYVGIPESEAGLKNAEAASKLIEALAPYDNARVVIGPAIIYKSTDEKGRSDLFLVPLSEAVQQRIEQDPSCLATPTSLFIAIEEVQNEAFENPPLDRAHRLLSPIANPNTNALTANESRKI